MNCHVCGKYMSGNYRFYCSAACKQKAYRERKKQERLSKKEMMRIDDMVTLGRLRKMYPELAPMLNTLVSAHGVEAATDAVMIAAHVAGIARVPGSGV